MFGQIAGGLIGGLGSWLSGNDAADAAEQRAAAERQAAQQAADAMRFRPVGVTGSPFGSANYGYDAQGNLTSAGYKPSGFTQSQMDKLMGASGGMLSQFTNAQKTTAPMGVGAQSMFNLGNQYLTTSPEAQAQKYMEQQQALLAAPRADQLAQLRANQQATGRSGLAVGGNAGMLATNPEMAAYYNSLAQQDLGLAANATQGGMDYAKFGTGMINEGGNTLKNMYGTQTASYGPYQTAIGGVESLNNLAMQPMTQGMQYGFQMQPGQQASAGMLQRGLSDAARYQYQSDSYSPWGSALMGAGNMISGMSGGGFFDSGTQAPAPVSNAAFNPVTQPAMMAQNPYISAFSPQPQQYNFGTFMGRSL